MRMTKKDHTLLWLSRLRLNPGKQMGFAAEGQEEQAWMSFWPAPACKEEKGFKGALNKALKKEQRAEPGSWDAPGPPVVQTCGSQ